MHTSNSKFTRISKLLTPALFNGYWLYMKHSELNIFHLGESSFYKYTVDQYWTVGSKPPSLLRHNQQKMRTTSSTALCIQLGDVQSLGTKAEEKLSDHLLVLSSTYIGENRYMRHNLYDILSVSKRIVHPDFFRATTSLPDWQTPSLSPSISLSLPLSLPLSLSLTHTHSLTAQNPQCKPDSTARVILSVTLQPSTRVSLLQPTFQQSFIQLQILKFLQLKNEKRELRDVILRQNFHSYLHSYDWQIYVWNTRTLHEIVSKLFIAKTLKYEEQLNVKKKMASAGRCRQSFLDVPNRR